MFPGVRVFGQQIYIHCLKCAWQAVICFGCWKFQLDDAAFGLCYSERRFLTIVGLYGTPASRQDAR